MGLRDCPIGRRFLYENRETIGKLSEARVLEFSPSKKRALLQYSLLEKRWVSVDEWSERNWVLEVL